jgi:hypothetical protein
VKQKTDSTTDNFKACLIAQGFQEKEGIYFDEPLAPIVKWRIIKSIVALVAHSDLQIFHLDKDNFLKWRSMQGGFHVTT